MTGRTLRYFFVVLAVAATSGIFQPKTFSQEYDYWAREGQYRPRPETPEIGLPDDEKRRLGGIEGERVLNLIGQAKTWIRENGSYKGQSYTIFKDVEDPEAAIKAAGVNRGIKIMRDRGVNLPTNLKFYLITDREPEQNPGCVDRNGQLIRVVLPNGASNARCAPVQTIAFKRGINFAPAAVIFIKTTKPTSPQAISGTGFANLDKTTITTIHEVGHILHERNAGEFFWILKGAADETPNPISQYGAGRGNIGRLEFVAEVFAASVIGMPNLGRFEAEYRRYRGPYADLLFR